MAVVLRNVAKHDWGWFSREDPRMHIQTLDSTARLGRNKIKVWLEDRGRRIFDLAEGQLSGPDLKKLEAEVRADRPNVESQWVTFMIRNDWLKASLSGATLVLDAYPGSHNSFTRRVDLPRQFPGAYKGQKNWLVDPPKVDFDYSLGLLAIGPEENLDHRNHLDLSEFLFEGA